MTAEEYRKIALGFPEASEESHMDHPDFRVKGKIFATLGPGEEWGALKLNPEQQEFLIRAEPNAFKPASGAWGKRGYTIVTLSEVTEQDARSALTQAWRNTAPKQMVNNLTKRIFLEFDKTGEKIMSESEVLANQQTIITNQQQILANQEQIKSNQHKLEQILANQEEIKTNQAQILANQQTIISQTKGA